MSRNSEVEKQLLLNGDESDRKISQPNKKNVSSNERGCTSKSAALIIIGIITFLYVIAELGAALYINSLTLLSDGFHNLTDVASLFIAWWAQRAAKRDSDDNMSYGWARAEVLGGLTNGCFLISMGLYVILESIPRIIEPEPMDYGLVFMIVAGAGLAINITGTIVFAATGQAHAHSHGGGGHSHGGHGHDEKKKKKHGHSHGEEKEKKHGHSHGEEKEKKHGHSHGEEKEKKKEKKHGHSHGDEDDSHGHSHGEKKKEKKHGHSHGDGGAEEHHHDHEGHHDHSDEHHGHAHGEKKKKNKDHGHSHDNENSRDSHGHSHGDDLSFGSCETFGCEDLAVSSKNEKKLKKKKKKDGHGHGHGTVLGMDLNMFGVFIHFLGDAISSLFVLITGVILRYTHGRWTLYIDPVSSMIIISLTLASAVPLVKRAAMILLQQVPSNIDLDRIRTKIRRIHGVLSMHDLHVWQLVDGMVIASVHVGVEVGRDFSDIVRSMKKVFHSQGIHSTSIQPEFIQRNPSGLGSFGSDSEEDGYCVQNCVDECDEDWCCKKSLEKIRQRNATYHTDIEIV